MNTPRSRPSWRRSRPRARAWTVLACLLAALACSSALGAGDPPADAAVVGTYRFTYTVVNAPGATRWLYKVRRRCGAPCLRFSVIPRLSTQKQAAKRTSVYTWMRDRREYERRRTLHRSRDCVGRDRQAVPAGYDIISSERIRVTRTGGGRVLAFKGTGRDSYRPNARGRRGGCRAGAYLFEIVGLALPGAPRGGRPTAAR